MQILTRLETTVAVDNVSVKRRLNRSFCLYSRAMGFHAEIDGAVHLGECLLLPRYSFPCKAFTFTNCLLLPTNDCAAQKFSSNKGRSTENSKLEVYCERLSFFPRSFDMFSPCTTKRSRGCSIEPCARLLGLSSQWWAPPIRAQDDLMVARGGQQEILG